MLAFPFLLVFIAGLGVAVYTMLHGVTAAPAAGRTTRIGMMSGPSVAAFAIVFGAIGYLCTAYSSLSQPIVLAIALAAGAAAASLSAPLLARIASVRLDASQQDGGIAGQLAKVRMSVTSSVPGEISYSRDGTEFRQRALSLTGQNLEIGCDVVIDRIADGIAYVEDWETVERRL